MILIGMPLITIKTSIKEFNNEETLLKKLSSSLAELTAKPEKYVMVLIEKGKAMMFSGTLEGSCYVEVKSIGSIDPVKMSSLISLILNEELGIDKSRIYINFDDVEAKNWGYNGSTFG